MSSEPLVRIGHGIRTGMSVKNAQDLQVPISDAMFGEVIWTNDTDMILTTPPSGPSNGAYTYVWLPIPIITYSGSAAVTFSYLTNVATDGGSTVTVNIDITLYENYLDSNSTSYNVFPTSGNIDPDNFFIVKKGLPIAKPLYVRAAFRWHRFDIGTNMNPSRILQAAVSAAPI